MSKMQEQFIGLAVDIPEPHYPTPSADFVRTARNLLGLNLVTTDSQISFVTQQDLEFSAIKKREITATTKH